MVVVSSVVSGWPTGADVGDVQLDTLRGSCPCLVASGAGVAIVRYDVYDVSSQDPPGRVQKMDSSPWTRRESVRVVEGGVYFSDRQYGSVGRKADKRQAAYVTRAGCCYYRASERAEEDRLRVRAGLNERRVGSVRAGFVDGVLVCTRMAPRQVCS